MLLGHKEEGAWHWLGVQCYCWSIEQENFETLATVIQTGSRALDITL
jgi:hypothetical protein